VLRSQKANPESTSRVLRSSSKKAKPVEVTKSSEPEQKKDEGYHKFVVCIDVLTRWVWVEKVERETVDAVLQVLQNFLSQVKVSQFIGDLFFASPRFVNYMKSRDIEVTTFNADRDHQSRTDKLGILNRFARTIKLKLQAKTIDINNPRWIDELKKVVDAYNKTQHSTLPKDFATRQKMTPQELFNEPDRPLQQLHTEQVLFNSKQFKTKVKLKVGDKVRYYVPKENPKQKESEHIPWSLTTHTITGRVGNQFKLNTGTLHKPHELKISKGETIKLNPAFEKLKTKAKAKRKLAKEKL
jgi:hypothetical protein